MNRTILLMALTVVMSAGCETAKKVEDKALDLLARGVDEYCQLSETGRMALREKVDERTAPRTVRVEGC